MLVRVSDVHVDLIEDGDTIVRRLNNGKGWEDETRSTWRELVRKGRTVIDVGAYTGVYSIASAMMGADVLAMEPHSGNCKRFRDNVRRNKVEKVGLIEFAASDDEDCKELYAKRWADPCDTASLQMEDRPSYRVKTMRVDQLHFTSPVCLVKIDAEYHEVAVLIGTIGVIKTYRPRVLIETLSGRAQTAVHVVMSGLGYVQRAKFDGRNGLWESGT
jgi:FkbM family methyltransferase